MLLNADDMHGHIQPLPTHVNLMIESTWSQRIPVFVLIVPAMSKISLSPLSRLLPLLENLPVHAVGLHFRHIVSLSFCREAS